MKDRDEIWIVRRTAKSLQSAIVCDGGKVQAKELRRKMQQMHGGEWVAEKTTRKLLDKAKAPAEKPSLDFATASV